jgi:hypothetical protein
MERLAEKMKRSRAPQASITKEPAERDTGHEQTTDRLRQPRPATERPHPHEHEHDESLDPLRGRPHDRSEDDDFTSQGECEPPADHPQETNNGPVNIRDANPADIQLDMRDLGDIQLAYSTGLYDLQAHTGEPTYVLFGGWQTEQQLGFIAAVQAGDQTDVHVTTTDRDGKDIQTELRDRIGQIIEHSQTNEATNTSDANRENPPDLTHLQLEQDRQPEAEYAPETQQDHQQEHEQEQENDLSNGIE